MKMNLLKRIDLQRLSRDIEQLKTLCLHCTMCAGFFIVMQIFAVICLTNAIKYDQTRDEWRVFLSLH